VVTFRFYVVSTVAFFLALAVGIVIGSALDERLVEGLQNRIETVENDLDDTVETIDEKDQAIDELDRYVEESAPYTVEQQLGGTQLLVVAEQGVESEPVKDLVRRAQQSGAATDGIIWLQPKLALTEASDREALADAIDVPAGPADDLRAAAWTALAEDVAVSSGLSLEPEDGTTTTSTTEPGVTTADGEATTTSTVVPSDTATVVPALESSVVAALADAGFVRAERVEPDVSTTPSPVERLAVVFVTGEQSDLEQPGAVVTTLAREQAEAGIPSVVAAVFREPADGDGLERGEILGPIRSDPQASTLVSTVDDLELIAGQVAAILATADLDRGVVGHYGYGPDADSVVPPWREP
jgi:hypothetical protein